MAHMDTLQASSAETAGYAQLERKVRECAFSSLTSLPPDLGLTSSSRYPSIDERSTSILAAPPAFGGST